MPIDFFLDKLMEDSGIHPQELYFSFTSNDPDCGGIIVYHPLCTKENKHLILQLAYAAMYNLLGERSFGMDINHLEVANLSCADPDDVQKLTALPACMGLRGSSIVIDHNGRLMGMG